MGANGLRVGAEPRWEPYKGSRRTRVCNPHNPSFALAHTWYGLALLRAGRFDRAIEMTLKARRMSPADSFAGMYSTCCGLALLGARRFAEALPMLRAAIAAFPEFPGHYNALVSCCGHLGLLDEVKQYLAYRNKIGRPLTIARFDATWRSLPIATFSSKGSRRRACPRATKGYATLLRCGGLRWDGPGTVSRRTRCRLIRGKSDCRYSTATSSTSSGCPRRRHRRLFSANGGGRGRTVRALKGHKPIVETSAQTLSRCARSTPSYCSR